MDFFYRRLLNSRRTFVRLRSQTTLFSLRLGHISVLASSTQFTTEMPLRYLKSAYPLVKLKRLSQNLRQPLDTCKLFSSEKDILKENTGLFLADCALEDVGGGAALFDKAVYVYACLFLLCLLIGDWSLA